MSTSITQLPIPIVDLRSGPLPHENRWERSTVSLFKNRGDTSAQPNLTALAELRDKYGKILAFVGPWVSTSQCVCCLERYRPRCNRENHDHGYTSSQTERSRVVRAYSALIHSLQGAYRWGGQSPCSPHAAELEAAMKESLLQLVRQGRFPVPSVGMTSPMRYTQKVVSRKIPVPGPETVEEELAVFRDYTEQFSNLYLLRQMSRALDVAQYDMSTSDERLLKDIHKLRNAEASRHSTVTHKHCSEEGCSFSSHLTETDCTAFHASLQQLQTMSLREEVDLSTAGED